MALVIAQVGGQSKIFDQYNQRALPVIVNPILSPLHHHPSWCSCAKTGCAFSKAGRGFKAPALQWVSSDLR